MSAVLLGPHDAVCSLKNRETGVIMRLNCTEMDIISQLCDFRRQVDNMEDQN